MLKMNYFGSKSSKIDSLVLPAAGNFVPRPPYRLNKLKMCIRVVLKNKFLKVKVFPL